MAVLKKYMKLNNIIFGLLFFFFSCQEKEEIVFTECVECVIYEYQQLAGDSLVSVFLDPGIYCVGDSIFSYSLNSSIEFLEFLDYDLLNLLNANGYCTLLTDTI